MKLASAKSELTNLHWSYSFIVVSKDMLRLPNMTVLLLSVHPLLDQSLLHLHPIHKTDIPSQLQSLISKCLHTCPRPQLVVVLTFRPEHFYYHSLSKGGEVLVPLSVSLVTNEPTYNPL